jgi:DNA-binding LacI/PurR family transcriptional regulator
MFEGLSENVVLDRNKGKKLPLYQQISERIGGVIKKENLQDGYGLPSVAVLARMLNVSYRTAKLAYDLLESAEVLRYVPNKGAVVNQKTVTQIAQQFTMTYIRPRVNSVWASISMGIEKFCSEKGVKFSVADANSSHELYLRALQRKMEPNEGVLVVPYELPEYYDTLRKIIADGTKVVFVDRILPGMDVSSVCADHYIGVYEIVSHLLSCRDLPVYYFGQYKSPSSCRSWFEGWKTAMNEYGYNDIDSYVYDLSQEEAVLFTHPWYAVEDVTKAALNFLKSIKQFPCSVFASGDHIAKGIYIAGQEIGIKVGKDVFLAGYGNIPMCEKMEVPLSSVDQNSQQVGYRSAELLYKLLKENSSSIINIMCSTKMHIRQSSLGTD